MSIVTVFLRHHRPFFILVSIARRKEFPSQLGISILDTFTNGLRGKWRNWIYGCLSSSRASVIVNGSPTKEFNLSKEVCQGDLLSHFLFIISMEGLNTALKSARNQGIFSGIKIPNGGPRVSSILCRRRTFYWRKVPIQHH